MNRVTDPFRNWPLGVKLAGLASLLVVAAVVALMTLTVQRERASFHQEVEAQAQLLLDTLPLTMRDSLYRLEIDELADIAGVIRENEHVALFIIYDKNGAVLIDAAQAMPEFSQTPDPLGLAILNAGETYLEWQTGQLVAGRTIALGNQRIGAVAIGLSTAPLESKLRALTRQSLLLVGVTLALGSSLAFLMARQMTVPLGKLAGVAAQMAGGDLSRRVAVTSQDEIGRLAGDFNRMADAIQKRDTDLRDFAAGLERKVAARTADLLEQNEALLQANADLTTARRQAEAADREKSAVLSMGSHELRTPLTSILGFARLIKRKLTQVTCAVDESETVQKTIDQTSTNIDIITSEGARLLTLINDFLDLAKIESGRVEWDMEPLSIAALIEQSTTITGSLFKAKSLELHVDVAEELPPVVGDRDRLIQVMVNLISNAIKYTETGSITCRARRDDAGVTVSVRDTGVGVAPEDYERIFQRFMQSSKQSANAPKGTGLGLPLCKEIIEHHGGRIWVESTPGEGSTFSFTLPIAAAEPPMVAD